jgi:hypothetical protein
MSNNNPLSEEKKSAILLSGVMSSLKPELPSSMSLSLSNKQNYAIAAEEIFCHALNRTIWVYRNDYAAIELIALNIRNTAMESVATEAGISRISDLVLSESVVREFVLTLQTQFFSQFAEFNDHWEELVGNIATGLTNGPVSARVKKEMSLMPEEISSRTYSTEYMKDLLLANNWLTMFILIALWGRIFTYEELRAIQRRATAPTAA